MSPTATRLLPVLALVAALPACAGSIPLLHPAHVLRPGLVSAGAGVSGQLLLVPPRAADTRESDLESLAVAPGVAPWVGGRIGIAGSNEAGLTYSGRAVRLDGRHAFALGVPTLSIGLGASMLLVKRPGQADARTTVYGVGFDLPVLLGVQSRSDIYALWFGPRPGFELIKGEILSSGLAPDPNAPMSVQSVSGRHFQLGGVLGARAGFRHLHVAVEVGAAYHRVEGEVNGEAIALDQATIAPGGALIMTF